ncbi:cell wall synthase accessory phosphoprotein MacP [Enterococcus pseudoavium]|uniref:Cell wall synthase accessory phosphoprotein MacP n=1 Tax=Enterococcus pseudoavium TaxID=44007 RepID=A0AAE4KX85_9ENTE|nr:cell wall synthase accessory phosphoprotein MacP [Enterococcus pseudoavium]MDT2737555.1 cell wall synthase accessory phosphoprotein MacP [Enterococcus pseudoavium]MDT2753609.1 cell wall synthase accessory phosphoprotein MacP [Enterococcus pseudoavium]MDT2771411.1 cell wall synthase accessory phosphoprotein MacP [Enterococcus pseudoavium]REC32481.1 hypothetical protein CF160_08445 [Enterococcus pseudoavium]
MGQSPLVTRSELRKRKEEQARLAEEQSKAAERAYEKREKEISNVYRKELKKHKPVTKSRSSERVKQKERSSFLNKAIIVVLLLLIIVMLAVFFI